MIKLIHLFSGIGAFEKALEKLGADFDVVNYCEVDKYAAKAYSLIHGIPECMNLGDITKVDETQLGYADLICYGFPCQDISLAGNQKGLFNEDGSKTRSGLFFDALRIINQVKPKVAIAENVKHLLSVKFKDTFNMILHELENVGYDNYYFVLNAKDFGIPQNRERVFIVSIRKDIDPHNILDSFFVAPRTTGSLVLSDLLEKEWDSKYILSDKMLNYVLHRGSGLHNHTPAIDRKIAKTINTTPTQHRSGVDNFVSSDYAKTGTSKNDELCLLIKCATKQGYMVAHEGDGVDISTRMKTHRGTVQHQSVATIMANGVDRGVVFNDPQIKQLGIRKLTPTECFRLMGFEDKDCQILKDNGISESRIYHMAGNSIVVNVAQAILEQLIEEEIL